MTTYRSKETVEAIQYNGPDDREAIRQFCEDTMIERVVVTSAGNLSVIGSDHPNIGVLKPGDWLVRAIFDRRFVTKLDHDDFSEMWEEVVLLPVFAEFDGDLDIPKFLTHPYGGDKPIDQPLQYARPLEPQVMSKRAKWIAGGIAVCLVLLYAFMVML